MFDTLYQKYFSLNYSLQFLLKILFLTVIVFCFYPFLPIVFFGKKFLNSQLPKYVKIGGLALAVIYGLVFNIYYFIALFWPNIQLFENSSYYLTLFWVLEPLHTGLFALFIFCVYRVIRYQHTPYSLFYAGFYNLIHCLYNACPISLTSNFFAFRSNPSLAIDNIFWRGIFGSYAEPARYLLIAVSVLLLYASLREFKALGVQPREVSFDAFDDRKYIKAGKQSLKHVNQ